jgi:hypothetical protein
MKRFSHYISEGRYPVWVKVVVGGIVMRLSNLQSQIESETDEKKRDALLGRQNKLLGYISGLGIGVNSNDPKLLTKLRSISNGKSS